MAREGIKPRSAGAASNWDHTASSSPDAVYLTSAYALYYARHCQAPGDVAILRIDTEQLEPGRLVGDEDAYAQTRIVDLDRMDLQERTVYWRERLAQTSAATSLKILGNCAYLGTVPPQAIVGVRLLAPDEAQRLTLGVHDPVIVPVNYHLFGRQYEAFHAWLAGEPTDFDAEFEEVLRPSRPVMTLEQACSRSRPTTRAKARHQSVLR